MKYINLCVIISILVLSCLHLLNGNPSPNRARHSTESNSDSKDRQFLGFQQLGQFGGGGGGNNGGNPFRQATVTRTVVRTVSTVTVVGFRTCTTSMAGLTACAGRRRREIGDGEVVASDKEKIDPEPSLSVIIGTTTLTDPSQISSVLHLGNENSQYFSASESVITEYSTPEMDTTTVLYPSQESVLTQAQVEVENDALSSITTNTPVFTVGSELNDDARINLQLAGTSTVTVTISMTSIATTFATGTTATLTVLYSGCSPPTLPVSTILCA